MAHHKKGASSKKAQTRMPPEEDPEFQIAPMIDILLVLLVFFMSISSTEVLQTNDKVRLPAANAARDKKPVQGGQLLINVLWNPIGSVGSIDINNQNFATAPEIVPMLKDKLNATPEFRLVIRADKEVRYEYLRTVLTAAAGAGVKDVTFSVVDKDDQPAPQAPH